MKKLLSVLAIIVLPAVVLVGCVAEVPAQRVVIKPHRHHHVRPGRVCRMVTRCHHHGRVCKTVRVCD